MLNRHRVLILLSLRVCVLLGALVLLGLSILLGFSILLRLRDCLLLFWGCFRIAISLSRRSLRRSLIFYVFNTINKSDVSWRLTRLFKSLLVVRIILFVKIVVVLLLLFSHPFPLHIDLTLAIKVTIEELLKDLLARYNYLQSSKSDSCLKCLHLIDC